MRIFLGLVVYAALWTLTAFLVFATIFTLHARIPECWGLVFFYGFLFLMIRMPLNVVWLACMVGFCLLHRVSLRTLLRTLEKRRPSPDNGNSLLARSPRVGAIGGILQAGIVCAVAVSMHPPGTFVNPASTAADELQAFAGALPISGTSAWFAALAGGWVIGRLWMPHGAAGAASTP